VAKRRENIGFTCVHCGTPVAPVTNGSYRNLCPVCLWSVHVDDARPGDRASACGAPMEPVNLLASRKGFQILHRCTRCGKRQPNIAALETDQDDFEALLELMKQGRY
jgi:hypothetical protein